MGIFFFVFMENWQETRDVTNLYLPNLQLFLKRKRLHHTDPYEQFPKFWKLT